MFTNLARGPRRKHKRFLIISIIAISIYFVCIAFQYISPSLFAFNQQAEYWAISAEKMEEVGLQRYVKDAYLILFSLLWVSLYIKAGGRIKIIYYLLGLELTFISIGLIGHVLNFNGDFIFAGLRWMVLLHCSIGMYLLVAEIKEGSLKLTKLDLAIKALLLLSVIVGVIQWLSIGLPMLGAFRFYSIYSNAGVFGYTMVGVALYFLVSSRHFPSRLVLLLLCLLGGVLSGTRSSMLLISTSILVSLLPDKKLSKGSGVIVMFFTLFLLGLFSFIVSVVDDISQRGKIADNLSAEGGRVQNIYVFFENLSDYGFMQNVFGRGLGSGTNSIKILGANQALFTQWDLPVDNTILPIYQQFGIVGLLFSFVLAMRYLPSFFLNNESFQYKVVGWYFAFSLVVLFLTQNMMESYSFLPLFFISSSLYINNSISYKNR
jgi:hypothetical protein